MKLILLTLTLFFGSAAIAGNESLPERLLTPSNGEFIVPNVEYFNGSKLISINEEKTKFILLNFWATWCPACVAEMSSLDSLAMLENKKNLKVIAVNVNEGGPSEVKPFLSKFKFKKMSILYDSTNKSSKDFAIRGLPTTFLISPKGKILAKIEGSTNWNSSNIRSQIEKYIDMNQ